MKTLGIGLIGSGFMGRCHVNAYNSIASIFEVSRRPVLKILADATHELASQQAKALQFEQSTADWQELEKKLYFFLLINFNTILHRAIL